MHEDRPELSIIIPSFNTADLLLACIESIFARGGSCRREIIVVDNGSSDDSVERVRRRFPEVTVIALPSNRGYGSACNVGAERARGELLLFLNSDTRLLEGSLDAIREAFRQFPYLGAVACHELAPTGETVPGCRSHHTLRSAISFLSGYRLFRAEGARYQITGWDRKSDRWVDNVSGFAWAIRRDLFFQIGRFDENLFFYFEEPDVARRLQVAGRRIRYVAGARIIHHNAASTRATFGRLGTRWQWVKSFAYWRKKHGLTPSAMLDRCVLLPFLLAWRVGHWFKQERRRESV